MSRTFTSAEDRIILDGRAAGLSWSAIGARLGTTGKACQYRPMRGLQVPDPKPVQVGRSRGRRDYDRRYVATWSSEGWDGGTKAQVTAFLDRWRITKRQRE